MFAGDSFAFWCNNIFMKSFSWGRNFPLMTNRQNSHKSNVGINEKIFFGLDEKVSKKTERKSLNNFNLRFQQLRGSNLTLFTLRGRSCFHVGDLRNLSESFVSGPFFLKTLLLCREFTDLDRGSQVIYPS